MKRACVVLPTYNEAENIGPLLKEIFKVGSSIKKWDLHVLVADDKSPDGTGDIVKKLQKKNKKLHLIQGEKQGLGVAYIRAFNYITKNLKMDVMFSMDADYQHPPKMIPEFLKQIDAGYDLVIGSRYIKGGGTPDWNLKRKVISRGGNFFARVVAGMFDVHDCTSGFRAIKTDYYKKIDINALSTRGYAHLSTLLYELRSVGAKIKEIPLVFYDRQKGQTKMKSKDLVEFFFNAFRLRFKSSRRMIKFGIVGGSGIVVNLGIFTLMKLWLYPIYGATNITLLASSLVGDEISIIYNFFLNNFWTFKNNKSKTRLFHKILKFHVVAITSVIINNIILFLLHTGLGWSDLISKFIGIVVAFLWNYIVNVKWTWREKLD